MGISLATSLLAACASSGVMTADQDTYMIVKRTAQVGFGPPVAATAYVYREANAFCPNKSKKVEPINLGQVASAFGRLSSTSLKFRCVSDTVTKSSPYARLRRFGQSCSGVAVMAHINDACVVAPWRNYV